MERLATPDDVIAFWREAGPDKWFSKDEAFDQACRYRFMTTYEAAARGDLNEWELTPEGALAVILLLDQFPRNMFRGTKRVYATDPAALMAADRAIERGYDKQVDLQLLELPGGCERRWIRAGGRRRWSSRAWRRCPRSRGRRRSAAAVRRGPPRAVGRSSSRTPRRRRCRGWPS